MRSQQPPPPQEEAEVIGCPVEATVTVCLLNKAANKEQLRLRLRLLLLILQSGQLRHGEDAGHEEHAEDDPQGAGADVLPGQLVGVVVEELGREATRGDAHNVSQTAHVMVAQSVGQEELAAVEHDGVELDGLHEGGNVAAAQSSNTDSAEAYDVSAHSTRLPTHPQTETRETVATRGHGRPANLVDGKMGRHHSSSSVLFLDVASRSVAAPREATTSFSGTPQEKPSEPSSGWTSGEAGNDEQEEQAA